MRYLFGEFDFRPDSGELFRNGERLRLQPQPIAILAQLLEQPGELVTRQKLIHKLWGSETFGETETGLNIAVKKLRDALGDSPEHPTWIETLPRRGYRFVGQVATATTQAPAAEFPERCETRPSPWRARIAWITVGLLGLGGATILQRSWPDPGPALEFRPRDAVLIAEFRDETGETGLDGVVETLLEAELSASPHIAVASPERIGDSLKLMRQPVSPRVPLALAREVCLRDPGLRAAIGGEIRKVGSGYLLAADVVRPADGPVVTRLTENAINRDQILPAVRRLSSAIRRKLGERLPDSHPSGKELERVSTNSFEALRLYGQADALGRSGNWVGMETVLRRVISIDGEFASAYIMLGLSLRFQRKPDSANEIRQLADRALQLAPQTPQREELFIRGAHAYLRDDFEGAKRYLDALLREFPDHFWGDGLQMYSCVATGDLSKLPALYDRRIQTRPNEPRSYRNVALQAFCGPDANPLRAVALAEKAVSLAEQQGDREWHSRTLTWLYQIRAMAAWLRGDVAESYAQIEEARKLMLVFNSPALPSDLALGYLILGRLEEARAMLLQSTAPAARARWNLWHAILRNDPAQTARFAKEAEEFPFDPHCAQALARAGRHEAVAKMLAEYRQPKFDVVPQAVMAVKGELAFRQGRVQEAIEILQTFLADINSVRLYEQLPAAQTLAQAYLATGHRDKAVQVLEKATAAPRLCSNFHRTVFWPYARFDLLKLYRSAGRHSDADALHRELANLMRLADSGHVLLVGLQQDATRFAAATP